MFDSSLPDEMSVLKPLWCPCWRPCPRANTPLPDDILRGYQRIEPMEESYIAANSLVREFIGGSTYVSPKHSDTYDIQNPYKVRPSVSDGLSFAILNKTIKIVLCEDF